MEKTIIGTVADMTNESFNAFMHAVADSAEQAILV